jgi:hypothetical protein
MTVKFVGKRRPLVVVYSVIVLKDNLRTLVHFSAEYALENTVMVPIECMARTWSKIRTKIKPKQPKYLYRRTEVQLSGIDV